MNEEKGRTPEENKKLIEECPFLLPRNRWTDEVDDDYDYTHTELDNLPCVWCAAFGMEMVKELKAILESVGFTGKYRIVQIKEKYGGLRWYDNGIPKEAAEAYDKWLDKYRKLAAHTCIVCGARATKISVGWYAPYCDKCAEQGEHCIDIKEFYGEDES